MNTKDSLDLFLSDVEKELIGSFVENQELREAVRKVLLFGVYNNGTLKKGKKPDPTLNFALGLVSNAEELHLDNEKLGAQLRACWEAIKFIELAWSNLEKYKPLLNPPKTKSNPAL